MLLLGGWFIFMTGKLPPSNLAGDPGPALFPYVVGGVMIICAVVLILQKSQEGETAFLTRQQWFRLGLLFLLFIVFAVAILLFGFYPVAPVMLFGLCHLFSMGKQVPIVRKLIYTAAMWGFLYVLFRFALKLALPGGILL